MGAKAKRTTKQSVPPLKRRVHLSCLSKKDGTRKKDTPGYAPYVHPCTPGARATTRFFDGTSVCRRKTARIVRAALRVYPPSPAAPQGPRTAAGSCPQENGASSNTRPASRLDTPRVTGADEIVKNTLIGVVWNAPKLDVDEGMGAVFR